MYDVAVIGAGPAGLFAAQCLAEKHLKVVVAEKRKDISKTVRACTQLFYMDEDYEKESIKIEQSKIIFPRNGFEIEYNGPLINVPDFYHISPGRKVVHYAYKDRRPCAVKFDKGFLLRGLWQNCQNLGVELRLNTVAYSASDDGKQTEVNLTCNKDKSKIQAKKVIVADGANSRIAESLGINKTRSLSTISSCMIYTVEGLSGFKQTEWKQFHMGHPYEARHPMIVNPSLDGEELAEVVILGKKDLLPDEYLAQIMTRGPQSSLFAKARIVNKKGACLKIYTPLRVPHRGNALVIGDAAAFSEVGVQGALMCGYHAATAIIKEIEGKTGFDEYTKWWQTTFEFFSEKELMSALSLFLMAKLYTDDELDYLFGLTEDIVLDGCYDQWRQPKLLWSAIFRHEDKIVKERPDLFKRISKYKELGLTEFYFSKA